MQPARQDLSVTPGTSYRDIVRIMQPSFVYRAIAGIAGAPLVLTVPNHGLDFNWPVWVRGVQGMPNLNREPFRQLPHPATFIDGDKIEINALSATGLKPTAGELIYRRPVNLSEALPEMSVYSGEALLFTLTLGQGIRLESDGVLSRFITAEQSALLVGADFHYTLDLLYAGPTRTRYLEGAINIGGISQCDEQNIVTAGEQGAPGIGAAEISSDPNNRLQFGSDLKLYVSDDFTPDPLNYYLLERGNI